MNKLIISLIIILLVVGVSFWITRGDEEQQIQDNDSEVIDETDDSISDDLLSQLPHEANIDGSTITFDRDSIGMADKDEYAELPYEITIGEETRLIESWVAMNPGESPIKFIERFVETELPDENEEGMHEYTVSFYPMSQELAIEYPSRDTPDTEPATEGVHAYVKAMNLPDDSVGGTEDRFDFIVTENERWAMVWHGERNYCRRMDNEFWQPADQLCP